MNNEQKRLQNSDWKKWGPYVSDRQWGTVREDYSNDGNAWEYTSHDMARSKTYRWGEEGIAGISDEDQLLCIGVALWNKEDPILKERFFGLTGKEGNHGEDVKELYYYLDATPTHSYMKMLYKYPQNEFPYSRLLDENRRRGKQDREFELMDTGIFDEDKYFDVFVEYVKAGIDDLLIKITIHNRGNDKAMLNVLPTVWFRNTWDWGYDEYRPGMFLKDDNVLVIDHEKLGRYYLYSEGNAPALFTDNETNSIRLYNYDNGKPFHKDGINDYIVHNNLQSINPEKKGTKATLNYDIVVEAQSSITIRLRFAKEVNRNPFGNYDEIFSKRTEDADNFYNELQAEIKSADERLVQRQAFAGMLWSKQFYYFDVQQWIDGDPAQPSPPEQRKKGRNHEWMHLNNADIISMPDKWEYPWYAAWDLAFHSIPLSIIDSDFAKKQLLLLTKEWYMHPSGQMPAYEWDFSDVNPPVHAWATWRVFQIDRKNNQGKEDISFLESVFHKLLLNFTWWVNRKDRNGNNIFQGGFLGLDNIGIFDRNESLSNGGYIEQTDGTSWMAMYSLNMLRISLELAKHNKVYADMATKFFEHFLYIAGAMAMMGESCQCLWDDEDEFFYDILQLPNGEYTRLKLRSMVGLIPMFAVEIIDKEIFEQQPEFVARLNWFLKNRPDLANLVSRWNDKGSGEKHLLSLLRGHRLKKILERMLDETEFLSAYGIRALSKFHEEHPYELEVNGKNYKVKYIPGESDSGIFGGNSNWRGPIWMPMNYLVIESLQRFHYYYGDDFKVEYPTDSGCYLTLDEIATELCKRLAKIFLKGGTGRRPVFGQNEKMQQDPHFKDYVLFYEYFHGDSGRGVGASHQTGWTGLVAKMLHPRRK